MSRGPKSAQPQTRTRGTQTSGLRSEELLSRADPNRSHAVMAPSSETIRRAIEAGVCPWCGRGPFRVIAGHTSRTHGVGRLELRDLAGLTYTTSLVTDERLREAMAERARATVSRLTRRGSPGQKRNVSAAGRKSAAERLATVRATMTTEQVAMVVRASHTPEVIAKANAAREERYGPMSHGTRRMYRRGGCRCTQCRAANARAHAEWKSKSRSAR